MDLQTTILQIQPPDAASMETARRRFASIAMPLGALGLLQQAVIQLAGAQRTARPCIDQRVVVPFCADNGVVAQGVTQCGQEVTAIVAENMGRRQSTVCLMAKRAGVDVLPVDIGVARELTGEGLLHRKIRYGTADLTEQPAMTREQAVRAVETGIAVAEQCAAQGYRLLCTGEMGIGNTTTSAAVTAALLGLPAETVTGRGAGLSSEGLRRKVAAVERGLARHKPDPDDPIDVLHKVGGLDMGGLAGLCLGGAAYGVPVVLDGVIACASALLAVRLCPAARGYLLPSHRSDEPAGALLLEALQMQPLITAGMRLGEGTGAVAAVSLLDLALAVYDGMQGFDDMGIEAYQPLV